MSKATARVLLGLLAVLYVVIGALLFVGSTKASTGFQIVQMFAAGILISQGIRNLREAFDD